MASLGVNLNDVNPEDGELSGGVVPRGTYHLQIVEGEVKDNSKNTGKLFEYTAEVLDGEFQGRKIWERINVTHQNPVAQKIGQGQLAGLVLACGLPPSTQDSDELLYQPFHADVEIETYKGRDNTDKEKNVIKKYHYKGDVQPPDQKAQPQQQQQQQNQQQTQQRTPPPNAAAGKPNMPWKK